MPQALDNSALLSLLKPSYMPLAFGLCTSILFLIPHSQFNNIYSLGVMAVFLLIFMLCILAGHYSGFKIRRVGLFYIIFGIMVFHSYTRAPIIGERILFFYLTAFLMILIIQGVINSRRALYTFICVILSVITASGIYGIYQRIVGIPVRSAQIDFHVNINMPGRAFSFYDNPNQFAQILLMTLPLYIAMFYISKSTKHKVIIFLSALPPAMAMLLTYSRSGWGALAAALLIFFLVASPKILPAIFIAGAAMLPLIPATVLNRALTVFRGGDSSTQFRDYIKEMVAPILQNNWIRGTGLGHETIREAIRVYYPEIDLPTWAIPAHTHNIYLQVLIEMGIFGALAAGLALLAFFVTCIGGLIKSPARDRFIIAAGMGSIAGMLIMGMVEHIWFYPRVMLMFWMTVSIALTAVRLGRKL
jgi:O-antigen ligase